MAEVGRLTLSSGHQHEGRPLCHVGLVLEVGCCRRAWEGIARKEGRISRTCGSKPTSSVYMAGPIIPMRKTCPKLSDWLENN
jgi:hypothetical protein